MIDSDQRPSKPTVLTLHAHPRAVGRRHAQQLKPFQNRFDSLARPGACGARLPFKTCADRGDCHSSARGLSPSFAQALLPLCFFEQKTVDLFGWGMQCRCNPYGA
jgi:hypothetical protein